jgi:hypothetical protein
VLGRITFLGAIVLIIALLLVGSPAMLGIGTQNADLFAQKTFKLTPPGADQAAADKRTTQLIKANPTPAKSLLVLQGQQVDEMHNNKRTTYWPGSATAASVSAASTALGPPQAQIPSVMDQVMAAFAGFTIQCLNSPASSTSTATAGGTQAGPGSTTQIGGYVPAGVTSPTQGATPTSTAATNSVTGATTSTTGTGTGTTTTTTTTTGC